MSRFRCIIVLCMQRLNDKFVPTSSSNQKLFSSQAIRSEEAHSRPHPPLTRIAASRSKGAVAGAKTEVLDRLCVRPRVSQGIYLSIPSPSRLPSPAQVRAVRLHIVRRQRGVLRISVCAWWWWYMLPGLALLADKRLCARDASYCSPTQGSGMPGIMVTHQGPGSPGGSRRSHRQTHRHRSRRHPPLALARLRRLRVFE